MKFPGNINFISFKIIFFASFILFFIFSPSLIFAKDLYDLQSLSTSYHLSFESIRMPDSNEKNMGLFGAAYRLHFFNWFYGGINGFGAVAGERGGLFVLGLSAGIEHALIGNIWGDAGIDLGGGGGQSAIVNSGLMFRPHIGLSYDFGKFRLGASYSKVHFPDGRINSNQFGIFLDIPDTFGYADPLYSSQTTDISTIKVLPDHFLDFESLYIAPLIQYYFPISNPKDTYGNIDNSSLGLVGIEIAHFMFSHPRIFLFLKASGAYHGDHNGYMDILGGVGYRYPLFKKLFLKGQLGLGAGGGGHIDTGGGFLIAPNIGAEVPLTNHLSTELSGGYLIAPSGDFKALTAGLSLLYSTDMAEMSATPLLNPPVSNNLLFRAWRIRITNQIYINPQRKNDIDKPINLVEFKADTFVNNHLYLTGQAGSAYSGQAGGYSTGMLGAGFLSSKFLRNKIDAGIEFLAGAGGGGGLDVGGGFLLQPQLTADYYLTKYFSIDASCGHIYAPRGRLNTTTFDIGIAWHFALPEAK